MREYPDLKTIAYVNNCENRIYVVSNNSESADIAIVGGGIAGLWNYCLLLECGYKVILLENRALGSGQTIASQGIIHSGVKYSLSAMQSNAGNMIKDMPTIWRNCIEGNGIIDLSSTSINSHSHWLWPYKSLSSKLSSFFASQAMQSRVNYIDAPRWFSDLTHINSVYALEELVLDVPSLLACMQKKNPDNIIKCVDIKVNQSPEDSIESLDVKLEDDHLKIKAKHYIFSAGASNTYLTSGTTSSQERPLHMLWVKDENLPNLFGHVVAGLSSKPMLTITSHALDNGNKKLWYIGGNIAEDGMQKSENSLILELQQNLSAIFPKLQLKQPEFGCFKVNRVEGIQKNKKRPDSFVLNTKKNVSTIWPTKLALAPLCAMEMKSFLESKIYKSPNKNLEKSYPKPLIAKPIWEGVA